VVWSAIALRWKPAGGEAKNAIRLAHELPAAEGQISAAPSLTLERQERDPQHSEPGPWHAPGVDRHPYWPPSFNGIFGF
jgi:hypothetical protein